MKEALLSALEESVSAVGGTFLSELVDDNNNNNNIDNSNNSNNSEFNLYSAVKEALVSELEESVSEVTGALLSELVDPCLCQTFLETQYQPGWSPCTRDLQKPFSQYDCLVGLVVRRPPREWKIPGSKFFRGRFIPVT